SAVDQRRSTSVLFISPRSITKISSRAPRLGAGSPFPMSRPTVEPGTPGAGIIEEEERLLGDVVRQLGVPGEPEPGAPLADYDRELIELRDAIAEAKPEDLAPLVEQMARLSAIAARRGRSRALPVDPMSPYFAHLR